MKCILLTFIGLSLLYSSARVSGEVKVLMEHNANDRISSRFKFEQIPSPSKTDAATRASFTLVDGIKDGNGGDFEKLHDGRVPAEEDQPSECFFFNAGTEGGRLLVDLGAAIQIKQINTYSWHSNTRGPQVYQLYASDGKGEAFNPQPKRDIDPAKAGWTSIAKVDTRPKEGPMGGQYAASISASDGAVGQYRYLLFDIFPTEAEDSFGNTFYSEIDVIDLNAPLVVEAAPEANQPVEKTFEAGDGKYEITIITTAAPDLTEWADKELAPVVKEWYPKLVDALPSDGYEAPKRVRITFKEGMGGTPAATGGSGISCNIGWFRRNLKGEAKGAVVHELVHVVQQYGRGRRNNPNATRTPGWLTEGIPDYLRWFKYEPETHGAEIRNIARAKFDASYRVTGNFLNWVTEQYDKDIVRKLNAAAREGKYDPELWKSFTGKTVQELGDEWKKGIEQKLSAQPPKT